MLKKEMYECWLKLFDYCKFWLHNFDQGMKCAWISPRHLVPLSMKKMKDELKVLMTEYYQTGRDYANILINSANQSNDNNQNAN